MIVAWSAIALPLVQVVPALVAAFFLGMAIGLRIGAGERARLAYDVISLRDQHRQQWLELDRVLHGRPPGDRREIGRPLGVPLRNPRRSAVARRPAPPAPPAPDSPQ